jgi:hypothetical protein
MDKTSAFEHAHQQSFYPFFLPSSPRKGHIVAYGSQSLIYVSRYLRAIQLR